MKIESRYKLSLQLLLFAILIAALCYTLFTERYILATIFATSSILTTYYIISFHRKTLQKIALMFDAIENNDYMFRLKATNLKHDDELLNDSLNRMKILVLNARAEVRERERYFESILNQINSGILIIQNDGIVLNVNKYALDIFSISMLSHINQLDIIANNTAEQIINLKDGTSTQVKFYNESSLVRLSLTATELRLRNKELKIITITDILSDVDQAEIDSWAKMSRVFTHEIMNSLAPITAISETLADSQDTNYIKQGAKIIQTTSERLIGFVNSYRSLTKIPKPKFEEVDIEELATKNINLTNKNIPLNITNGNHTILADPDQISQVLINLLKNATEATHPDKNEKIWVNIAYNSQGKSYIEVCNNGTHISDEVRENIFVPFFTTKSEGTGIGLSLSRQIMRLHEGSITLTTKPHTSFKVSFSKN